MIAVRKLKPGDAPALASIAAARKLKGGLGLWQTLVKRHSGRGAGGSRIGLVAVDEGGVVGYVLGEVRAFEFGSEACGWIYSIGVHPKKERERTATHLVTAALAEFRSRGVMATRTMVRKEDIPLIGFFRAAGFTGGPFVELERGNG